MKHEHITWPRLLWLLRQSEQLGRWQLELALIAMGGCGGCRMRLTGLVEILESDEMPQDLGFYDLALARSRHRARALWRALEKSSPPVQAQLAAIPASYGLVELLIQRSETRAGDDPALARSHAEAAVAMASRLPVRSPGDDTLVSPEDEEPLDEALRVELLALAWGCVANAQRAQGNFSAAEIAFEEAERRLLEAGGGSIFNGRARVLALRARLLSGTRRLDEAIEMLQEAACCLREDRKPDSIRSAEIALQLSIALGLSGDMEAALASLKPAVEAPDLPARLTVAILQQFAAHLVMAGTPEEARTLLPRIRQDDDSAGSPEERLHVQWLSARIASAENRHEAALETLLELQERFMALKRPHEAALVALETTIELHELGHIARAVEHARATLTRLVPMHLSVEVMIALSLVTRLAAERDLRREFVVALLNWVAGGAVPITCKSSRGQE